MNQVTGPSGRSSLSAGKIAYWLWYKPKGVVERRKREGWGNLLLADYGRAAMERAARRLPALKRPDDGAPTVHFLTGSKFWYQTLFCAYSLTKAARRPFRFVILDDGTLSHEQSNLMTHVMTDCSIRTRGDIEKALDTHLPFDRFPTLRKRRVDYPHLRKLTDVHVGSTGWKVVLDSDMLFHQCPHALLHWLSAPSAPLHMLDIESAYGYSPAHMRDLAGTEIPNNVNVGVCGLNSADINWDRLETWCRILMEREGSHYLQEQALTAMLMGGDAQALPASEAIVRPSLTEVLEPKAALHHYVAESKAWYFRHAWRRVSAEMRP